MALSFEKEKMITISWIVVRASNILNVKLLTNAKLSYITCGQEVPDDINKLDAQSIAKQLLGGEM